jgi:hypothetical protein
MARYKYIATSPRFLPIDLARQLLPGTFGHAVHHPPAHAIGGSRLGRRAAPQRQPAVIERLLGDAVTARHPASGSPRGTGVRVGGAAGGSEPLGVGRHDLEARRLAHEANGLPSPPTYVQAVHHGIATEDRPTANVRR